VIESGYNPGEFTRARGGLQFIPSTGRRYGLQKNWWYDGRRDVLAATRAALDYRQQLARAIRRLVSRAGCLYTGAENGVTRAIAQNRAKRKPTDYRACGCRGDPQLRAKLQW